MAKKAATKKRSGSSARSGSTHAIPAEWEDAVFGIPGYDPTRDAVDCWFDGEAAARAVDFFSQCLSHIEGDLAGKPFALEPWQRAVIANLFGWMRKGKDGRPVRRYRELFLYVPRKNGKALDVETPIPTPAGWKRMGDLRVGDTVFDHDGNPTMVKCAFNVLHDRECFEVVFSDGTSIVADAEHLWETDARSDRDRLKGRGGKHAGPKPSVKTTSIIRDTLTVRGELNHRIPVTGSLKCEPSDLPVEPYALGVRLGDGDSDCARFTASSRDFEVCDLVRAAGTPVGEPKRDSRSTACRYRLGGGLQTRLRAGGLLHNKHIPPAYLRASVEQRMALIQGLMDTDGYVSAAGQCEFTTTSPRLLAGFLELARSLGYKPTATTHRAMCDGKDCGEKYRVQFWAFSERPCFRLSRKAARLKSTPVNSTRSSNRQVVEVKPVASRPVRCIAVDSPRKLFLAGEGMVPTHNTPLCAGIGLFIFFCDNEVGQQGYIAAKDKEQAGHLFRQMEGMVDSEPMLKRRCRVYGGNAQGGQSRSFVKADNSFLKIISGDGSGKHGGNPHLVIVDELHEQQDRELIDALRTSMISANRRQSLMICLTTADYDRPSICNEKYAEAKRIAAEPSKDLAFLPVIFEADPKDDPFSPETWRKANPNLEVSVSIEELGRLAQKAKDEPAFDPEFRRLHLNLRTRQVVERAIDIAKWDACSESFDASILRGRRCWAGIDFGWRDDYAALVLVFPGETETDPVHALCWFWVPDEGRRDIRTEPTARFIANRFVTVTEGNSTDMEAIYETLREIRRLYDLQEIAYDPNNAGKQGQDLAEDGFEILEFHQRKSNFTEPWTWLSAEGLASGRLRHGGNPVLRWMAQNTAVEVDGLDGVMPKKRKSPEKIDGICALCMAIGAWLVSPVTGQSVYETRGLESLNGDEETRPEGVAVEGTEAADERQRPEANEPPRWFFGDDDEENW